VTLVFKEDNTIGLYRYGWKPLGHNENEPLNVAGKEKKTCLLDIAGKDGVKASVKDTMQQKTDESPTS
jgi:hypothetical protein